MHQVVYEHKAFASFGMLESSVKQTEFVNFTLSKTFKKPVISETFGSKISTDCTVCFF